MHMQAQTISPRHWTVNVESLLQPLLQAKRLGLVTDMDGTISHAAETPEAAVVTPRNRELLGTLVLMLPMVAAISGRSARDLQARIAIPGIIYIGNHGLERWVNGGRVLNENVRQYRKALAAALDDLHPYLTVGMWIEDKYATASLHYRLTPHPENSAQYLEPLLNEVARRYNLTIKSGHRLFEIRPPIVSNKGTTLVEVVQEYDLDAVLYLGDDYTDIDALKAARRLRESNSCYAIGVGVSHKTSVTPDPVVEAADVIGEDVKDIESLLAWLLRELSQKRG